jgi:hypothetical protein
MEGRERRKEGISYRIYRLLGKRSVFLQARSSFVGSGAVELSNIGDPSLFSSRSKIGSGLLGFECGEIYNAVLAVVVEFFFRVAHEVEACIDKRVEVGTVS